MLTNGDKPCGEAYYKKRYDRSRRFRSRCQLKKWVPTLVSLLVASACGGQGTAGDSSTSIVNFAMVAQNASSVAGTGRIARSSDSFTITLKLTGMTPASTHVSHLHAGKCSAPGGIAFALQSVVAGPSGAATTISTVPVGYAIPAFGWYVNVHHGPDFTEPEYAPSDSCGDLPVA